MFVELTKALNGLRVSNRYLPGDHLSSSLKVGGFIPVLSRSYDPSVGDTPLDIDQFNFYDEDDPQVTLSVEEAPLVLNILNDSARRRRLRDGQLIGQNIIESVNNSKVNLANKLANELQGIRTGSIRRTRIYDADTYIYAPGNLSFIVDRSEFDQFDPSIVKPSLKKYIGIRVLHEIEVEVPANIGTFQTGDKEIPHLDTNNPKILAKYNNKLRDEYPIKRSSIIKKWQGNLSLVDVVFNPLIGINSVELDNSLASTVKKEWA